MYPQHFPGLPNARRHDARILEAHGIISSSYNAASSLLRQESTDHLRLRIHAERLKAQTIPLLEALERDLQDDAWVTEAATAVVNLIDSLKISSSRIAAMCVTAYLFCVLTQTVPICRNSSAVKYPDLTFVDSVGAPGRPKIEVDRDWLKDALSRSHNISLQRLSQTLKISQRALRERIREYGLSNVRFDDIADNELDALLREFKQHKPQSGRRYAIGHLRNLGYRIQRRRVVQSLQRIDGLGQELRRHQQIVHREYRVPRSNYLWHIDGHHKLIAWGIVIHGIIDGFCRTVNLINLPTVLS